MPLDSFCLSGVVSELHKAAVGGKVDKIYQPGRDEIILALRAPAGNVKLLLCANPSHPRAQLTQLPRENPDAPPMFCMLLRKHLLGARVLDIVQPPLERVIDIRFEALDELGDRTERRLILEAMGRRTNLILLDKDGRITDCIRRVDADMSAQRQILPGLFYRPPTPMGKANPLELDRDALEALLARAPEEAQADKWLLDTFGGMSPLLCRELAHRAGGASDVRLNELGELGRRSLLDHLEQLTACVREGSFAPTMLLKEGKPYDFTFFPVEQYGTLVENRSCASFAQMLDDFYEQRESMERIRQHGQGLIRSVTNARDRAARKIGLQEQELASTQDREKLREMGDIITSNLHMMERGMTVLKANNFYDPDFKEIEIRLDPLLTPQQNAAKYYKNYTKARTAEEMLTKQLEKGRQELDYLNSVLENISIAEGERDLQDIRQELIDTGYLRRTVKGGKGKMKRAASKPMEFRSSTGLRISVGKNNLQNDMLTCKQAFKSDIWFHTQKIHGSHVILWLEGGQADLQSLNEAACLAAWFSQGRDGGKVPVDYTSVKYVKKPAGAKPGKVIYSTYETAWVTPDEALVKKLRVK